MVMVSVKDLMRRVVDRATASRPPPVLLDDDVTTDKALKALRRQRRVQMEEIEKKDLVRKINSFNRRKDSWAFSGDGHSVLKSAAKSDFRKLGSRPERKARDLFAGGGFL